MPATYAITRDEAIKAAMQLCQALGQGESPTAQDITDALPFIQSLLKHWDLQGFNTWVVQTISFPLVAAKQSYTIGDGGGTDVAQPRPFQIAQCYTRDVTGNDIPQVRLTRQQYEILTPKTLPGNPNSFYYDRQLTAGVFYPWPVANGSIALTQFCVCQMPIQDLANNGTATFNIDQEWYLPLILNIAKVTKLLWGTPADIANAIDRDADNYLTAATAGAEEQGSVFFQPSARMGHRYGRS